MMLSILFSILVSEMVLRIFFPQPLYSFEKNLFMDSPEFGYCLTPNVEKMHRQPEYSYIIQSNSYGFRGKEPNFKADYRVLVLGDSFGMGQGVGAGKNLCELSQQYLNSKQLNFDIFNTSISGYAGVNQVQVLHKFIEAYNPGLVILLFYWNDIGVENSLNVQNGYLVLNAGNKITAPLREWLNTHSHFYCLIKRFYYAYLKNSQSASDRSDSFSDAGIAEALSHIIKMKEICDHHGSSFVVILPPWEGPLECEN